MQSFQGVESVYCNVCIGAVIAARRNLLESTVVEALRRVKYGKSDTLGLDATPEIVIADRLTAFNEHCIIVTEELDNRYKSRWPTDSNPELQPLMFFSDPTDRSNQFRDFLMKIADEGQQVVKIGELWRKKNYVRVWEKMFEAPASITGPTTSITSVRKGKIIFSVILNYLTGAIYVACASGVYQFQIPDGATVDLAHIQRHGATVRFPPVAETHKWPDDYKRFVTFLGKSGYRENFNDSMLFVDNPDRFLYHKQPGGPTRALYLSELQKGYSPVGFVMANGEKIGEWIPWLAFVKFAKDDHGERALRVYEISIDRPWTKEGILMSTSPAYSLFCDKGENSFIDVSRLRDFEHPSRFRSMLVVTRSDNDLMRQLMQQHCYREVGGLF